MLPLAVPGLVMAFGFIAVSSALAAHPFVKAHPALAALLDVRENPTLFLVIAYAVRRLPYMVRAAVAGLQQAAVRREPAGGRVVAFDQRGRAIRGPAAEQQDRTVAQGDRAMADPRLRELARRDEGTARGVEQHGVVADAFLAALGVAAAGTQHRAVAQQARAVRGARRRHVGQRPHAATLRARRGHRPRDRGQQQAGGNQGGEPAHHPTEPSRLTSSNFLASTANSIGSSRNTDLQKPSTIRLTASSSAMPRLRQ